jgi:hypothetical protein
MRTWLIREGGLIRRIHSGWVMLADDGGRTVPVADRTLNRERLSGADRMLSAAPA